MMLKWLFDRTAALLGLLVLWPLLLAIAILVKVRCPDGKVIFRQKRIGQHGEPFTIYKFRTMTPSHSGSTVSVAGERRITPLGTILRRFKLDEMPELWNVLKGDMSLVGPRPDVPGYADRLKGEQRKILLLKPGITGPATLKYRNEEELLAQQENPEQYNDEVIYPDKTRLNLYYAEHYSFRKDIRMIFCTILGKRMMYNHEMI